MNTVVDFINCMKGPNFCPVGIYKSLRLLSVDAGTAILHHVSVHQYHLVDKVKLKIKSYLLNGKKQTNGALLISLLAQDKVTMVSAMTVI